MNPSMSSMPVTEPQTNTEKSDSSLPTTCDLSPTSSSEVPVSNNSSKWIARKQPVRITPERLREHMFQLAGITIQDRANALKDAFANALESLDAQDDHVSSHMGQVTEITKVPNHAARAKAREQIFKLVGVEKVPEAGGNGGGGPRVVIPLPDYARVLIDANKPLEAHAEVVETDEDAPG